MVVLLSVSFLIGSSIILFFRLKEDEHLSTRPNPTLGRNPLVGDLVAKTSFANVDSNTPSWLGQN
jgi:hypothetical protein